MRRVSNFDDTARIKARRGEFRERLVSAFPDALPYAASCSSFAECQWHRAAETSGTAAAERGQKTAAVQATARISILHRSVRNGN